MTEDFVFDFVYLGKEAAQYLADMKVSGVGIDGLGIERSQPKHPTHHILLSNNIIIIEGLRLKEIEEKSYEMICLPLKIKHVEATPARIILKDEL
jgi:arylformamidase